jgi:transcriptional regulator with XRE-family HTH domain
MGDLRKKFGRRLRSLRRQLDLTQEDFAELTDVSVDFISLVERGINAPSFESLERFAAVLKVEVYELFLFSEPQTNEIKG